MEVSPGKSAERPPSRRLGLWPIVEGGALLFFFYCLWTWCHPPLPSLLFHGLGKESPAPEATWTLSPQKLEQTLDLALALGYEVVDGKRAMAELASPSLRRPPLLLLSFDDGERSLIELALPLLKKKGCRATFFVNTRAAKGKWSESDIRKVAEQGFHVQSHAHEHESLARRAEEGIEEQRKRVCKNLSTGRDRLREILGKAPTHLAFPCGEVDAVVINEAKRLGFRYMYGCDYGYLDGFSPQDNLPRYILDRETPMSRIRSYLLHPLRWSERRLVLSILLLVLLGIRRIHGRKRSKTSL